MDTIAGRATDHAIIGVDSITTIAPTAATIAITTDRALGGTALVE